MNDSSTHSIASHATPMGTMWSHWSDRGLFQLDWDEPPVPLGSFSHAQPQVGELDAFLNAFFQHGQVSFEAVSIDPAGWSPFAETVYRCCRKIEPGVTVTYKQLAESAGNVNASRAVGAAMARNRILLVIPCHRVISTGGQLRGFSAPGGLATKRSLLDLEREGKRPSPEGRLKIPSAAMR